MLTFNNNHLITGYIKQLLSSFNLPTYKIYTKENQIYKDTFGVESPEIIETIPTKSFTYKDHIRYIPYIKDGMIQEYIFTENDAATNAENANGEANWHTIASYFPNKNLLNNSRHLQINNNIYDTYTHEYLGNYLRFMRDYYQVDLMSLYNCFSNKICQNLYIECDHNIKEGRFKQHFIFNSEDKHYKIYMLPVKLFKEYTIAIDCSTSVEICCGLFGKYQDSASDFNNTLSHDTYQQYTNLHFGQPILYSPLKEISSFLAKDSLLELITRENDLHLFIKLPIQNKSSISILEGNYIGFNDKFLKHKIQTNKNKKSSVLDFVQNHTITNLLDEDTGKIITQDKYSRQRKFIPISQLQLLTANTGISYPFADRLIGYLLDNTITSMETVTDNLTRVQTIVSSLTGRSIVQDAGVWDERTRPVLYNFLLSNSNISDEVKHDILGYADKDAEQLVSALILNQATGRYEPVSIANVDLYPDIYLDNKIN